MNEKILKYSIYIILISIAGTVFGIFLNGNNTYKEEKSECESIIFLYENISYNNVLFLLNNADFDKVLSSFNKSYLDDNFFVDETEMLLYCEMKENISIFNYFHNKKRYYHKYPKVFDCVNNRVQMYKDEQKAKRIAQEILDEKIKKQAKKERTIRLDSLVNFYECQ